MKPSECLSFRVNFATPLRRERNLVAVATNGQPLSAKFCTGIDGGHTRTTRRRLPLDGTVSPSSPARSVMASK